MLHCVQIEGLLSKYASHLLTTGKTFAAIELYRKANKATDSAMLLAKMALEITKEKVWVLCVSARLHAPFTCALLVLVLPLFFN